VVQKSRGGGEAEQVAEVDGNSDFGRKFRARDKIRRIEELILAMKPIPAKESKEK